MFNLQELKVRPIKIEKTLKKYIQDGLNRGANECGLLTTLNGKWVLTMDNDASKATNYYLISFYIDGAAFNAIRRLLTSQDKMGALRKYVRKERINNLLLE
ncbi:hypothetical protein [Pontibacter sp. SGAir0037]|uniref:hypothetical protein n=1 Tax=Pontibacter sp. SGAir0037 TaxID=2571030 RepID=UPI0010CCF1F5|nr:hypothetical protein [Pontibacter sp. SGAir0037]QCR22846.1 hypothetical protein C1N53_11165 [Pontibacter sp. SGAir0037]